MLVQSYKGEPASDFIPRLLWTPCTSAPRLPTRCRAKRRLFRFERRRRCLPSRRSVLSRCAASDAPKCLFAFTDGPKALSAALEAAHCLLSARTAQCAAGQAEIGAQMNTRRQRNCLLQPNRKRRRVQARAPARRSAGRQCADLCEKAERIGACFSPVGAKACPCHTAYGMPLCARRPREAGVRGRSLRLCAGRCGIDCRRSTRKSPTAKPKRPSRFRPSPLRVSARRIGNAAAESGEAVFAANKKSVCGAQPQTLIVHPFFFASR